MNSRLMNPVLLAAALLVAAPAGGSVLRKSVAGSGGGSSTGSSKALRGTIGQAALGRTTGSSHKLNSGFWATTLPATQFVITASAGPHGTIVPSGQVSVNWGANATFNLNPNTGYQVGYLFVDYVLQSVATTYTFTNVTTDHSIRVGFVPYLHTVTATVLTPYGTVAPVGVQFILHGGSATFTLRPDPGHGVTDVKVDGVSVGAVGSYTFTGVTTDHTLTVEFSPC